MTATHLPWAQRTEDWELRLQLWANETIIHLVHYTTNKWHALKGRGKGWRQLTFETYLPAHRTCNHPLCNHVRTWLDESGASNSRCVIEKGKRIVIIGLFQWCAAARRGGGMPTLTSASVWQVRDHCAGQTCCILVLSHPRCFPNTTTNTDHGNPIRCASPAVALSAVL